MLKIDSCHSSLRCRFSTVSQQEVDKFAAEAAEWWRNDGPALPLHAMNELRVPLVRNALTGYNLEDTGPLPTSDVFPLAGRTIVDVGCGPGIFCEVIKETYPHLGCSFCVNNSCILTSVMCVMSMMCVHYCTASGPSRSHSDWSRACRTLCSGC